MPTTYAIPNGRTVMNATTYTGNLSTLTVTNTDNGVSFKPDLVWGKILGNVYSHELYDSVRGVTKVLYSDQTATEATTSGVTAFNANGFTLGSNAGINNAAANVAWQWQAGQGSTSSNTNGTITSTVSVNTAAGFSIVTYTGPGPSNNTVGHGLGVAPKFIITKNRSRSIYWVVYTETTGKDAFLRLNTTDVSTASPNIWGTSAPTSTVFGGVGSDASNGYVAGDLLVSYCWAEVAGFSKFGSYAGNGSADGPFVYTGFRPRFLMLKSSSNAFNWGLWDSARNTYNTANTILFPNLSNPQSTSDTYYAIDFLSNGFKIRSNGQENNQGTTYIYAAFAENPFKYANAR